MSLQRSKRPDAASHPPPTGEDWAWQDLDFFDSTARSEALLVLKDFLRDHPEATMDHDPDWLHSKCGQDKSVKIFVCHAPDGRLSGYAPFFVHPSSLSFELFGIALWEFPIRRYSMTAGPLLSPGVSAGKVLPSLFDHLWQTLGRRETLFGLGVELDSAFGRFIQQHPGLREKYQLLPSGKAYRRRLIALPASFDQYIQGLSANTRKDIRRTLRQFEQDSAITVSYRVYTAPEEVLEFLPLAQAVSDKTYQRNLLGLGICDNPETRRNLTIAAENGWMRSYLLICNQQPVAFQHGYLHGNTYYAEQTGYDPAWARKSVGTIMQIYRIRDLIDKGVARLDFLYGDNEKKRSLSNTYREERNFHLIPRKFPLGLLAYGLHGFNTVSELMGDFIERWGLKSKIRRILRQRSTNQD
ncbi:GNAT family N-acetyltransferase [Nitrosomonas halophila]|uniref:Acetyltransferase (GNAT) domain-containing protein n=1 Tax=Nitrosomonas halophila TaxID=44576 RepID=A0A1H3I5P6_9PROT|nr:GNAT family N-acetyltransferase [Nitrosomonas halophila]SDY22294.1 Acetyltransferase (GNAT) domain-containing protein [Nitrosomonas halophila]